jgi:hypothetical protein
MLRIPHFLDNQLTDGGKVANLKHRSRSAPRNIIFLLLALILLEAEQTPGSSAAGKIR